MTQRRGIIAAGNWIVDQVKSIDRWPGEGNLCNILRQEVSGGGGACNVLFDLAAMNCDIPLFAAGRIGEDDAGEWLRKEVEKRGIHAGWLKRTEGVPTSYTDVMSGGGKRTFFHCRGANARLDVEDFSGPLPAAKIFYLGYLLLLDRLDAPDAEFGTRGARLLAERLAEGYETVVDFVSEAPEKFRTGVRAALPYVDTLVINELEAGNAFSVRIRRDDDSLDWQALIRTARRFLEAGVRKWVVIHYPEGACLASAGGELLRVKSYPVEKIVGTNGAGDAFCAGILYALHEDWPILEALQLANASAVFNLRSPTASGGAVSIAALKRYIEQQASIVEERI